MSKKGIVNISGKEYTTVARRVELAHEAEVFDGLETEVLTHTPVVIKATVTIKGKTYTGISAANPMKSIEKQSPYEVAETSAVGRALGFAGYGSVDSIASADEMHKAGLTSDVPESERKLMNEAVEESVLLKCETCGKSAVEKQGVSAKTGKPYHAIFCSTGETSHAKFLAVS